MRDFAIIGAGIAGLACARRLTVAGRDVVLFDKGRRPGGRLASRQTAHGRYDHGAQYFTARDPAFRSLAEAASGIAPYAARIARLDADGRLSADQRVESRFAGTPEMNAVARMLAQGLSIHSATEIGVIHRGGDGWMLTDRTGARHGPFGHLVVAIPAPQAAELLRPVDPDIALQAAGCRYAPCIAVMLCVADRLSLPFDALRWASSGSGPLSWAARRPGHVPESWVLHAAPGWSDAHIDEAPERLTAPLVTAFESVVGPIGPPLEVRAHRWRYALVTRALEQPFVYDAGWQLGLAGDWCLGPRVEAAWQSGDALGKSLAAVMP